MKLARADGVLWVAERQGRFVHTRRGQRGETGTLKSKELKDEARAEAYLHEQRQKRIDEGFAVVDEAGRLADPFTIDGAPANAAAPSLPAKYARTARILRTYALGGFPIADAAVARLVVEVLRAHGVDASWSGDVRERILIAPFVWWRRP